MSEAHCHTDASSLSVTLHENTLTASRHIKGGWFAGWVGWNEGVLNFHLEQEISIATEDSGCLKIETQ